MVLHSYSHILKKCFCLVKSASFSFNGILSVSFENKKYEVPGCFILLLEHENLIVILNF
ncbi:hypothetical protein RchiOBHm_Chr4g0438421 [Rosa chinensis]|uniref:Uncharacterized protein n=1 Tax=Rosa chinensis TaxID=74649 RepID=A0A2P6R2I4_ROSCH|nr:hypothetical protein RchiOBHm_Chr4g0438421 [Rosa chinensis]